LQVVVAAAVMVAGCWVTVEFTIACYALEHYHCSKDSQGHLISLLL